MDYRERLEEIFGCGKGPSSLRTIFDCDSTEWTMTTIEKKAYFLEKMLGSGYSLENWINDYSNQYSSRKYVLSAIDKSLRIISENDISGNTVRQISNRFGLLNLDQIFKEYLLVIETETQILGCKPTELRHLIGRLGEFYCAIHTKGTLAKLPNQHGFDVVSENGRKISVKTTAQTTGFVAMNAKTLEKADDIMVLQYVDGELLMLYYGTIDSIKSSLRLYRNNYEFDLSRAKKLTEFEIIIKG
ncbi:MAG: hypothetical protein EOO47_02750 [Flavobacterium sp.]|nr:MAG: hypothetical protein EOO47_02750 [Flavobacterium sp.]